MNVVVNRIAVAVVAALSLAGVANAEEAHHKDQAGGTPTVTPDKAQQVGMMQEHLLKMHEQMHKIMDAKSPQERDRLMQEHRDMMHKHMAAMRGGMMNRNSAPAIKGEPAPPTPPKSGAKGDEHKH